MSCNIQYSNGKIINVSDDSGNPSKLYKDAVDKFGEEKGLEIYLVSKSNSFLDFFAGENEPTLQEVTNYVASNNKTDSELNKNQKADLINVLISTPNFKAEDFYDEFGMFVIPQKYYSRYELLTLNEVGEEQIKEAVDALLNTEFAPNIEAVENAQKINEKNAFGKLVSLNPNIVKKEAIKAIVLSDESEVPYGAESFLEESKNYKKAEVLIETLDGEIISAKNNNTEQILPLVVKENFKTDLIDSLQNLSLSTLQKSEEQTKIVLKAIENDLISQGIDAIGLSQKPIDEELVDFLNTAKTFINSPTKENTKTFAEKSDIYFERDLEPKVDVVKSDKTDRNYVKLNTNLTEEQLYEKKGLIQSELGKGIYIQTAKESLEELYNNLRTYTEKYPKGTTLEQYVQEQIAEMNYDNAENAEAIVLYKMYFGVPNLKVYHSTFNEFDNFITDIVYVAEDKKYSRDIAVAMNNSGKASNYVENRPIITIPLDIAIGNFYNYDKEINAKMVSSIIDSIPNFKEKYDGIRGIDLYSNNKIVYAITNKKIIQYNNAIRSVQKQFTGNYKYLTGDYISDFYIDQLKEKQKNSAKYRNFYSNFEVNEKGINLLNTDDITMQQIEIYADDNLRQYSLISKQMPDLEVEEVNENPRDLVVNNPQTLENYKKDLFRVNEDTIILKDNVETFIKVNDEIYENVEVKGNLSTFAKIKTEKSDYYQYNIKQPKTNIKLSDYKYLSTQEELFTSPKKYLKQEEKNQIKNDKFNC